MGKGVTGYDPVQMSAQWKHRVNREEFSLSHNVNSLSNGPQLPLSIKDQEKRLELLKSTLDWDKGNDYRSEIFGGPGQLGSRRSSAASTRVSVYTASTVPPTTACSSRSRATRGGEGEGCVSSAVALLPPEAPQKPPSTAGLVAKAPRRTPLPPKTPSVAGSGEKRMDDLTKVLNLERAKRAEAEAEVAMLRNIIKVGELGNNSASSVAAKC